MRLRILFATLVAILLTGPSLTATHARAAGPLPDASVVDQVRSSLFAAQAALLSGDTAAATTSLAAAQTAVAPVLAALGQDPAATALSDGFTAATTAVQQGDQIGLAVARGRIWTALVQGARDATLQAIRESRLADASTWLLVRDFRPATKFARPGADATLAIRDLTNGAATTDQALQRVDADLLDTYQALLLNALDTVATAGTSDYSVKRAEAAGLVSGYWAIVAPALETQQGAAARQAVDAEITRLVNAVVASDNATITASQAAITTAAQNFRAAPLTEDEQARRAGQLLLYLSLIPVEYGRGVHEGQVTADIEIQEAQAFVDAARAAFNDLRLPLRAQNTTTTDQVDQALNDLNRTIGAAARHETVAEPGDVKDASSNTAATLKGLFPNEWERAGGAADFDVVSSLLDQMEKAVAAKQYKQAESARLEAYAIFEAGPEKHLLGFAPHLAQKVEQLFWQGTGNNQGLAYLLKGTPSSGDVRQTRLALDRALSESQQAMGTGRPATAAIVFNAATIVFREGLEAVLILASLMASMVGANQRFKRPLAIGAFAALGATAVLFVLARTILLSLGKYGEKLEAIVSLVAIGILLLVMNWFFHKVYWTKWIAKHHNRRRVLVGGAAGQLLGLVVLGFTSIFREGAESVLFLQALVLDAGTWVVIEGTLLGLLGVAVVGGLVFVLQKKLPHKKMLVVTGVMIATVLVTMVGTTVHVLQIVGWLPINPIESLQVPFWMGQWFGFFGTWEGTLAQAAAMISVVGSYYVAEHAQERRRSATFRGLSTANSQG
jgi:high-affinity iron transporter